MDFESFHTLKLNPFTDGFSHLATLLKLFIESNPDKENENIVTGKDRKSVV